MWMFEDKQDLSESMHPIDIPAITAFFNTIDSSADAGKTLILQANQGLDKHTLLRTTQKANGKCEFSKKSMTSQCSCILLTSLQLLDF